MGTITAVLTSNASNSIPCFPKTLQFGPYPLSRLTIGPNHNTWLDPNQFFLSIAGVKEGDFLGSMQSSITSNELNYTWWSLQAWQHGVEGQGRYQITASVLQDPNCKLAEERNQLTGIWKVEESKKMKRKNDKEFQHVDDLPGNRTEKDKTEKEDYCKNGNKHRLFWKHRKGTTKLTGKVNPKSAEVTVVGTMVVSMKKEEDQRKDEHQGEDDGTQENNEEDGNNEHDNNEDDDDNEGDGDDEEIEEERRRLHHRKRRLLRRQSTDHEVEYTMSFYGTYHKGSAPLPVHGLIWTEVGTGPPMEPFKYVPVPEPTQKPNGVSTTTSPTSTTTSATTSEATTSVPIITPSITGTSPPAGNNDGKKSTSLPQGLVAGIIVGGVLFLMVFMIMVFLIKRWLVKRKEPKVYPELAYIYSTPFTSVNKRTGGGGGGGARMGMVGSSTAFATAGGSAGGSSRAVSAPGSRSGGGSGGGFHQAPQLDVDVGDDTPFFDPLLSRSPRLGSSRPYVPMMSGGLQPQQPQHASSRREREYMERELRQPMLGGEESGIYERAIRGAPVAERAGLGGRGGYTMIH
ncbi:hypothetical protein BDZ91DRAFT_138062 [Kalaharituber pfeilii]|nr:hypothetical protein BDZ91DRAFT_138062 [Kalaharituber pfeilii]